MEVLFSVLNNGKKALIYELPNYFVEECAAPSPAQYGLHDLLRYFCQMCNKPEWVEPRASELPQCASVV